MKVLQALDAKWRCPIHFEVVTSLRALFNVYKRGFTNHMQITSGVLQSDNMLSIGEFMTLLQHLGLFDAPFELLH